MKKLLLLICFIFLQQLVQARIEVVPIDAERNAVKHNNLGVLYMQDRYYYPAIKEFQMAVMLNPDSQAAAVYYANLANCYMKIGYPALAQDTLQRAIKLNPMNLTYYEDLAVVFGRLKILDQKLKFYQKNSAKNPLSLVMVGMILMEQGKHQAGLSKLQEFADTEPDLIITKGVKDYVNKRTKERF